MILQQLFFSAAIDIVIILFLLFKSNYNYHYICLLRQLLIIATVELVTKIHFCHSAHQIKFEHLAFETEVSDLTPVPNWWWVYTKTVVPNWCGYRTTDYITDEINMGTCIMKSYLSWTWVVHLHFLSTRICMRFFSNISLML